jgi:hypothetical protein
VSIQVGDKVRLLESRTGGMLDGATGTIERINEGDIWDTYTVRVPESAISDETRAEFESQKADAEAWGKDTSTWDIQLVHLWDDEFEVLTEEVAA